MKKEINSSRLYKIAAKVLPNIIVLARLHTNEEDKEKRQEVNF
ncbi:hypothetical protein [Wolbachia endosymbiont of Wuchereria bancrofti]|nr:hypothetical protein [Wolbachia endosymbiont of Wuchereria bancrofti]